MDEVATILGGADHLEEAILNLKARAKPALIGVATTALVETRGEDFAGELAAIKARRAGELPEPRSCWRRRRISTARSRRAGARRCVAD